MFAWKKCGAEATTTTPQIVSVTATATQEEPVSLVAPPPPPKIEEVEDAGSDAGKQAAKSTGAGAPYTPCSNCQGTAPPGLQSAVRGAAQTAQGCYNRALRTSEVSGKMTVAVTVASTGSVCGVGISSDTTGSSEVRACVLGKFQGRSFPPPAGGCTTINVPINFTFKQ